MKTIYDIFKEFKNSEIEIAKLTFSKILKEYIHNQYHGLNKQDDLEKFTTAYIDIIGKKPTNLNNWLNPIQGGISRKSIIEIAFVLNQNKNGEAIANNLLQTMHYPRLHATSEREIFYIYALRNGISYKECQQLYHSYVKDYKSSDNTISVTQGTSTSFYHEMKDVTDQEKLFAFVNAKAFGIVSKKINRIVADGFEEMRKDDPKYKEKVAVRELNAQEMILKFYLFYSNNHVPLTEFIKKFKLTKPREYGLPASMTSRDCYNQYLMYKNINFYPCKSCSFKSMYNALKQVIDNKGSLSREGLLLWLLFYYQRNPEKYYTLHDINAIIGGEKYQRFSLLDENNYFDLFIMMVAQFELKDGKVFYGDDEEEIDTKDLNTSNIHELRHSIIRKFEKYFYSDFAADSFVDTGNSTTMRI